MADIMESSDGTILRLPRIALVVPSLAEGGGVPAVARFVKDVVVRSGRYQLKLISLATSSRDSDSRRFVDPASWMRKVGTSTGIWEGLPFVHVGTVGAELEFQRYRPHAALARVVADCDVLQVVCGTPAWANAVCGLGKPVAVQCATRARVERRMRDSDPRSAGAWWRRAMTAITDRIDDRALRSVNSIQVENLWMLDYAKCINKNRQVDLRYAPPGVNAVDFHPLPTRDLDVDPYILCVARLSDPRKNIGLLLEAYAQLPVQLIQTVRLVLAGSSAPPAAFWVHVNALGLCDRVTYLPRPDRATLIALYQQAAVFALPSDEEGLGVVLLEAMACGVPAVATRCGGPDGIIADGEDGYLVDLDDAANMALRIGLLLSSHDANRKMGAKARMTVMKRYEEGVAGIAFLDIWDHLLSTRQNHI